MDCNYELFYEGLRGLTNQQVIDKIYKEFAAYCDLVEEDITDSTRAYKERLRLLFEQAAAPHPDKIFKHRMIFKDSRESI